MGIRLRHDAAALGTGGGRGGGGGSSQRKYGQSLVLQQQQNAQRMQDRMFDNMSAVRNELWARNRDATRIQADRDRVELNAELQGKNIDKEAELREIGKQKDEVRAKAARDEQWERQKELLDRQNQQWMDQTQTKFRMENEQFEGRYEFQERKKQEELLRQEAVEARVDRDNVIREAIKENRFSPAVAKELNASFDYEADILSDKKMNPVQQQEALDQLRSQRRLLAASQMFNNVQRGPMSAREAFDKDPELEQQFLEMSKEIATLRGETPTYEELLKSAGDMYETRLRFGMQQGGQGGMDAGGQQQPANPWAQVAGAPQGGQEAGPTSQYLYPAEAIKASGLAPAPQVDWNAKIGSVSDDLKPKYQGMVEFRQRQAPDVQNAIDTLFADVAPEQREMAVDYLEDRGIRITDIMNQAKGNQQEGSGQSLYDWLFQPGSSPVENGTPEGDERMKNARLRAAGQSLYGSAQTPSGARLY